MTKKYGPSNWHERPEEHRTFTAEPKQGGREKKLVRNILDARDLMEEQGFRALERREQTPDAMLGLYWRLNIAQHDPGELQGLITDHTDLIRATCEAFANIPSEFIKEKGKSHRTDIAAKNPEDYANKVLTWLDLLPKLRNVHDLALLRDVLNITALFLDQQEKRK